MRVLLTGSRVWNKRGPIEALILGLKATHPDVHFILGDNPKGLDGIALAVCKQHSIPYTVHEAHWDTLGKGAGPERNGRMVKDGPKVAFAFREEGRSPGTDDCIEQARHAGIPCYIIRPLPVFTGEPVAGIKGYKYNSEVDGL